MPDRNAPQIDSYGHTVGACASGGGPVTVHSHGLRLGTQDRKVIDLAFLRGYVVTLTDLSQKGGGSDYARSLAYPDLFDHLPRSLCRIHERQ